jgi:outer membrane protein W
MQQMMERLLAKMDVIQAKIDAKIDANLKEMKAEIRANNEKMDAWIAEMGA